MHLNLQEMTIEQLKGFCKERKITGYSAPLRAGGKAGLIKFIEQSLNVVESVQVPISTGGVEEPVSEGAGGDYENRINKAQQEIQGMLEQIEILRRRLEDGEQKARNFEESVSSIDGVVEEPGAERVEAGGVEVPVVGKTGKLEELGFSRSIYSAQEERQFNTFVEAYKDWDIYFSIPNGGTTACILVKQDDCFHFPVGDSDEEWEFHFDYLDDKGVLSHAKRAIDAVSEAGDVEVSAVSDDTKRLVNKHLSNRRNGIKKAVQSFNKLNAHQLNKEKPAGEATKANLRNGLNALIVEIHLAANRISPGIGQNAVLTSTATLLDFLKNDRKRIDFAARYAAALNLNNDDVEECLGIKKYLEENFSPIKCQFKKGQLPSFEFEKINGIEYIEDALDPLEFHFIILAKCQSLWFCGYTHLINQESYWANGDELSVSLKFAQLKILTKGETVREAFERK